MIKYISWADNTGYSVAAKSYLAAFHRANVPVLWVPMLPDANGYAPDPHFRPGDPVLAGMMEAEGDHDTVVIHSVPEYYPSAIAEARAAGKRVFGCTVWELERLPDHWPAILNQLDGVIVPCSWNIEVFRRSGVSVPIHVVPHLSQFGDVPGQGYTDHDLKWLSADAIEPDRFMFYTIGHWSARKVPKLVLEAFVRAFSAKDRVSLVVKTSRNDVTRFRRHWRNAFRLRHPSPMFEASRILKGRGPISPVHVVCDESLNEVQMRALHQRGDCYVSLSRTEGWGLGAFDAALHANPVIMTVYGGQWDFLDPELAHRIDYHLIPVDEPIWRANYRPTDQWAEPDIDHAARLMRHVFERQQEANEKAHLLSQRLRVRFSEAGIIAAWKRALTP